MFRALPSLDIRRPATRTKGLRALSSSRRPRLLFMKTTYGCLSALFPGVVKPESSLNLFGFRDGALFKSSRDGFRGWQCSLFFGR